MNKLPIRVYSKKELALCYFPESTPHSAVKQLMAWIKRNDDLLSRLHATSYKCQSKTFSPRQVEIIIEYLGTPDGYD